MDKISIVIPAYNEEKRIGATLDSLTSFFEKQRKAKKIDYEILIVINNTKDKTEEVIKKYKKKNKRIRYLNFERGGKGFAVIEGFKDALKRDNNLIGFKDADMATSPEQFWRLVQALGQKDGIIADRYIRHSRVLPKPSMKRTLARRMFNFLIRSSLLLPYGDTQCGAKLFRRHALERTIPHLGMSNFAFDVDLLYNLKKKGFRIGIHPTIWMDQDYSTINFWQAGPMMAMAVARLRILNSPFKRFVRIYDKLIRSIIKK